MGLIGALMEAFRPIDLWAPLRPNTDEEALDDTLFSTEGLGLVHTFDRPAFNLFPSELLIYALQAIFTSVVTPPHSELDGRSLRDAFDASA